MPVPKLKEDPRPDPRNRLGNNSVKNAPTGLNDPDAKKPSGNPSTSMSWLLMGRLLPDSSRAAGVETRRDRRDLLRCNPDVDGLRDRLHAVASGRRGGICTRA